MKIFKKIGLIALAVLVGVASIFLPISNRQSKTAHADNTSSSYVFDGSSLVTVCSSIYPGVDSYLGFLNFDTTLSTSFAEDGSLNVEYHNRFRTLIEGVAYGTATSDGVFVPSGSQNYSEYYFLMPNANAHLVYYSLSCDVGFNCNVRKVRIYSESTQNSNNSVVYTYINYYDDNDNIFSFRFHCLEHGEQAFIARLFMYSDRTYFLNIDFTNNQFYNQGFADGTNQGFADGESIGYQNGYDVGYEQGEISGFNDGVESANRYTFLNLIGAVVDAPVSVFKTMFNFNLLGVNLKDFFLAILTFCGITLLVKFALMKG